MYSCASLTMSWTNIYSVLLLECKGAFHLQGMAGRIGQLHIQPINAAQLRAGARFSKVPKPFGRILGDIINFVSSKRKRLEARNFAVILIFIPFTTYEEISFQKKQVGVLRMAFRARKVFGTFEKRAPAQTDCY